MEFMEFNLWGFMHSGHRQDNNGHRPAKGKSIHWFPSTATGQVHPQDRLGKLDGVDYAVLPEADAHTVLFQVASAIAHIHSLQVVHRDLHLQNILLSGTATGQLVVKLGDFGFSQHYPNGGVGKTSCRLYVLPWRAPELLLCKGHFWLGREVEPRWRGIAKVDAYKLDLWALGCLDVRLHLGEMCGVGKAWHVAANLIQLFGISPAAAKKHSLFLPGDMPQNMHTKPIDSNLQKISTCFLAIISYAPLLFFFMLTLAPDTVTLAPDTMPLVPDTMTLAPDTVPPRA
jgi:serine/threonine protein kinase